ncbi:MAG: hypothetical protein ACI392_00870 [Paludibacteraceae bacterium]
MKKYLFLVSMVCCTSVIFAQNSAVEANISATEVEGFINECSFSKTDIMSKYSDNGVEIYPFVITDLVSGERMGGVQLLTESKMFLAALSKAFTGNSVEDDGAPRPLGYLDLSEVNDFIKVLEQILVLSKEKAAYNFTIQYASKSGIGVYYDKDRNEVQITKKWYSTNSFGVLEASYVRTQWVKVGSLKEIINVLSQGKERIEAILAQ